MVKISTSAILATIFLAATTFAAPGPEPYRGTKINSYVTTRALMEGKQLRARQSYCGAPDGPPPSGTCCCGK